ncbi:MAG: primosomal protein N', partial [Candidatus Nitrotoga sp.]
MTIVRVALDVPLSTLFDYSLGSNIKIVPGARVLVSFGRKKMAGVVMECAMDSVLSPERIKPILQVLGDIPPLSDELLVLLRFCSDYYHYPLGVTVLSALPVRLRTSQLVTLKEAMQYRLSVSGHALDLSLLSKRKVVQRRILAALKLNALSAAQVRALSPSAASALKA